MNEQHEADHLDTQDFDRGRTSAADRTMRGDRPESTRVRTSRKVARIVIALAYLGAGVLHIAMPAPFLTITPAWVPYPSFVILVTGLCEIAGAIALLSRAWRRAAGVALALYAICVFPANIKHAFEAMPPGSMQLGWRYHAPRLAMQPVLVWWALFAGEVVTWPFRRRHV